MKVIKEILGDLNKRMNLPQPAKSQLLMELHCDMNDLVDERKNEGYSDEPIAAELRKRFDFSEQELRELEVIHSTVILRVFNKIPKLVKFEKLFLTLVFLIIAAFSLNVFFKMGSISDYPKAAIPLIGFSFIICIYFIKKFYELYIKKEHNIRTIRFGVRQTFFFSFFTLVTGLLGFCYYLSQNAGYFVSLLYKMLTVKPIVEEGNLILDGFVSSALNLAELGMITIVFSLFGFIGWFLLESKVFMIESLELHKILQEEK